MSAPGGSSSRKPIAFEYCDLSDRSVGTRAETLSACAAEVCASKPVATPFSAAPPRVSESRVIPQILIGDGDLRLRAAQLNVIAREFRQRRDQRVAPQLGRLLDLRVGGFDRAPHMAPKVELPGGVEADDVIADRRNRNAGGGGARTELGQQAGDAVLAVKLILIFAVGVDRRQLRRGRDAALKAAFRQANRRRLHVEIGRGDTCLEFGQHRIAKGLPPCRAWGVRLGGAAAARDSRAENALFGSPGSGGAKSGRRCSRRERPARQGRIGAGWCVAPPSMRAPTGIAAFLATPGNTAARSGTTRRRSKERRRNRP